jgi:hypothetical protein
MIIRTGLIKNRDGVDGTSWQQVVGAILEVWFTDADDLRGAIADEIFDRPQRIVKTRHYGERGRARAMHREHAANGGFFQEADAVPSSARWEQATSAHQARPRRPRLRRAHA